MSSKRLPTDDGRYHPTASNKRFLMDSRDTRSDAEWFDVLAGKDGIFACIGTMACQDVCPEELPLLDVYAYLRRKALGTKFVEGEG